MSVLTADRIETLRDRRFRRNKLLQVKTIEEALDFVNEVGFCFAFAAKNSELPCLWHAACGARNPVMPQHTHHDPYIGLVWQAKDVLPAQRKIYYGKALKKRPTMISLDYFPFFYKLIRSDDEPEDYVIRYMDGELSVPARRIMDALMEAAPQITRELKQASGYSHPRQRYEFDNAMAELQMQLYIVKIGELSDPFTFVWDLVDNRFPEAVESASRITEEAAYRNILLKYFENVVVADKNQIMRLFGWSDHIVIDILQDLSADGVLEEMVIESVRGDFWGLSKTG
ncbi:hypothetical protein JXJ21_09350 [candidate division KSB1 bacterium]|nr:hypothetical protein [candidate division KSB1 bacterium]